MDTFSIPSTPSGSPLLFTVWTTMVIYSNILVRVVLGFPLYFSSSSAKSPFKVLRPASIEKTLKKDF